MYRQSKLTASLLLIFFCMLLSGCRLIPQPKLVTTEQTNWVSGQERVIAFADFGAEKNLSLPESFLPEIEEDLRLFFIEQGYTNAIKSNLYNSLLETQIQAVNGYYDVNSGRIDTAKHEQVVGSVFSTLIDEHQVDVLLYLRFVKTTAKYRDKIASWDNVEDHTPYPPTILWTMKSGAMPAISVQIIAVNLSNKQKYQRLQGIQVINRQPHELDIHPDDIKLHKSNLRKGLYQLSLKATNQI